MIPATGATQTPTTPTTAPAPTTTTTVPPQRVTANFDTSCTNSLTPTAAPANLPFKITATVPSSATAGTPFAVSAQEWQVTAPASLLKLGVDTGLISVGATLNGSVVASLTASNTAEGSKTAPAQSLSIGPVVLDPVFGEPLPIVVPFTVPDMTFTAAQGTTVIAMGTTTFTIVVVPPPPAAPLTVNFTCNVVGTTSLASVVVSGDAVVVVATTTTTTPSAATTTATLPATGPRAFTWFLLAAGLVLLNFGGMLAHVYGRRRAGFAGWRER